MKHYYQRTAPNEGVIYPPLRGGESVYSEPSSETRKPLQDETETVVHGHPKSICSENQQFGDALAEPKAVVGTKGQNAAVSSDKLPSHEESQREENKHEPIYRPMGFWQIVKKCLITDIANFSGRSTRKEFWWFKLFVFIIGIILGVAELVFDDISNGSPAIGLIARLVNIPFAIASLSVEVRRFHDTGRSTVQYGIYLAIMLVVVIVGSIVNLLVGLIAALAGTFYYIYIVCLKSEEGANKYGSYVIN